MKPTVGDTIVHPQHGTAEVTAIESREVGGVERQYVVLRRKTDSLTLHVPIESLEDVGLRDTVDEAEVDEVFAVLQQEPELLDLTWRKQHATNEARMSSGKVREIAAVVRDLRARDIEKGLSPSDSRIYRDARERLIEEIVAATDGDPDAVEDRIDETLGDVPTPA